MLRQPVSLSCRPQHSSRPCGASIVRPARWGCCSGGVSQAGAGSRPAAPCPAAAKSPDAINLADLLDMNKETMDLMQSLFPEEFLRGTKTAAEQSVQGVFDAMAAAEAAQAACMTTGRLAEEAAKGSRAASELLEAYSIAQQLYHKTYRRLLERYQQLAVTPAGLGYCIACDVLGKPMDKVPGDDIAFLEVRDWCTAAEEDLWGAAGSGALLNLARYLSTNSVMYDTEMYILPDILTFLAQGSFKAADGPLDRQIVEDFLLLSCSSTPVAQLLQTTHLAVDRLEEVLRRGGILAPRIHLPLRALFMSMPAEDQALLRKAEDMMWRCGFKMRGHLHKEPRVLMPFGAALKELWAALVSTALGHIAGQTMLQHVEGSRALRDWAPVAELLDTAGSRAEPGWAEGWKLSQQLVMSLLSPASPGAALPTTASQLEETVRESLKKGTSVSFTGSFEHYTSLMLEDYAVRTPTIASAGKIDWRETSEDAQVMHIAMIMRVLTHWDLKLLDASNGGGFPYLLYYLEVEQMALQRAGGQPGPAAKAAALELLDKLPHSVVLTRASLRVANMLAGQTPAFVGPLRLEAGLHAAVLARGDRRAAATAKAALVSSTQLPQQLKARAATAYSLEPSSAADSQGPTAAELFESALLSSGDKLSADFVARLFCTSPGPGPEPQQFDPALSSALQAWLQRSPTIMQPLGDSLWFAAAVLQLWLQEAAQGDAELAELLLGPGAVGEEYLRPLAEFLAAKQQTAGHFAEAVCRTGWGLTAAAAQIVTESSVLALAPPSAASFNAAAWLTAALLARLNAANEVTVLKAASEAMANNSLLKDLGSPAAVGSLPAHHQLINLSMWSVVRPLQEVNSFIVKDACLCISNLLAAAGGSFSGLEAPAQALVQAVAKRVVHTPHSQRLPLDDPFMLQLVQTVPLLHAEDYQLLMDSKAGDTVASVLWSAAAAAATDLQLAATPAFGLQRPDVKWLAARVAGVQTAASAQACIMPVLTAVARLLQQQEGAAAGSGSGSAKAAAAAAAAAALELLSAVCQVLGRKPRDAAALPYTALLQPAVQQLLGILQTHSQLELQPEGLLAALAAAIEAGAAVRSVRDASLLQAAQDAAPALQLSQQDMAGLHWAAVAGAARAVEEGPEGSRACQQLLRLWPAAVAMAQAQPDTDLPAGAAQRVAAAMAADAAAGGNLCTVLLQEQLPAGLLQQLLHQSAMIAASGDATSAQQVLQQLLANTQQQGMLQQLQHGVLTCVLQAVLLEGSLVPFSDVLQLLDAALQQGGLQDSSAGTATAQALNKRLQGDAAAQSSFAAHLRSLAGTPAAAAGQGLICQLLGTVQGAGSLSWPLFELLPELGPVDQIPQQQLLRVCSTLTQQLGTAGAAEATGQLLQVWRLACSTAGSAAAAVAQYGSSACEHVLTALVSAGEPRDAIDVVQAEPSLLLNLAHLWQQQQGQPVAAELVVQALQLCVADGTAAAAAAADLLLPRLQQDEAAAARALQAAGLMQGLMQLLSKHAQTPDVLRLLEVAVAAFQAGSISQADAVQAACAAVAAVTQPPTKKAPGSGDTQQTREQQQQQLVGILSGSAAAAHLARAAVSELLAGADPAAAPQVALLLHAAQQGGKQQSLLEVLQPGGVNQLCMLLGSSSVSGKVAATKAGGPVVGQLLALPPASMVAAECVEVTASTGQPVLSPAAAAQLINALSAQQPELQPASAAAALGLPGHAGPDTAQPSAGAASGVQVLGQLCQQQLEALAGGIDDPDELQAPLEQWVAALSHEAAAAALFAVYQGRNQPLVDAPAASSSTSSDAAAALVVHGAALPLLCLELYQRAKPTGDMLVFDLGLAAAAEAAAHTGDWHRGEGIVSAARKASQHQAADTGRAAGKRSSQSPADWLPTLPAACSALLSVLVHTEGPAAAARLLLREHEQQQGPQQQQGPSKPGSAAGRKGKAGASGGSGSSKGSEAAAALPPSPFLSPPVVNSFLSAVVAVVEGHQQQGADQEAAAAAEEGVQVAAELFKQQLLAVSLGAAGAKAAAAGVATATTAGALVPDASTWSSLAQLYGAQGSWQQVDDILAAAVGQHLPGLQPDSDSLQVVLAGAAAGHNAAGEHMAAVQLLDGLLGVGITAVSHPRLAQQVEAAAEADEEAWQKLIEAGWW